MIAARTGPAVNRHRSKQDYATPWSFFYACEARFGPIAFDLAASAHNAKCPDYFTKEQDSLRQSWHDIPGNLFLNPEFADIGPWAEKCLRESILGAKILFLVPASVGANWYRDYVHRRALVLGLNGRLSFDGKDPYPKDCALICWGWSPDFDVWTWGKQESAV